MSLPAHRTRRLLKRKARATLLNVPPGIEVSRRDALCRLLTKPAREGFFSCSGSSRHFPLREPVPVAADMRPKATCSCVKCCCSHHEHARKSNQSSLRRPRGSANFFRIKLLPSLEFQRSEQKCSTHLTRVAPQEQGGVSRSGPTNHAHTVTPCLPFAFTNASAGNRVP